MQYIIYMYIITHKHIIYIIIYNIWYTTFRPVCWLLCHPRKIRSPQQCTSLGHPRHHPARTGQSAPNWGGHGLELQVVAAGPSDAPHFVCPPAVPGRCWYGMSIGCRSIHNAPWHALPQSSWEGPTYWPQVFFGAYISRWLHTRLFLIPYEFKK